MVQQATERLQAVPDYPRIMVYGDDVPHHIEIQVCGLVRGIVLGRAVVSSVTVTLRRCILTKRAVRVRVTCSVPCPFGGFHPLPPSLTPPQPL